MKEDLIIRLLKIEREARRLNKEKEAEIRGLAKEYQDRMESEEKELLEEARRTGEEMVAEAEEKAQTYGREIITNTEQDLREMQSTYDRIKERLLEKYFSAIILVEGDKRC